MLTTGDDVVVRVYQGDTVIVQGSLDDFDVFEFCDACVDDPDGNCCDVCQSVAPPSYDLHIIGEDFRGSRVETGWITVTVTCAEDVELSGDPEGISVFVWVSNDGDDEITRKAWELVRKT